MKKWLEVCVKDGALGGWLILLFSIILAVASFFVPPLGVIDGSVLLVIAEINTGYVIIFKLPNLINSIRDGKSLKVTHGDTSVEIESSKED